MTSWYYGLMRAEAAEERAFERGRAAWPKLALSREAFARHLATHAPADEGERVAFYDAVHAADLFLACACLERVPGAVEQLDATVLARLPALLASLREGTDFVDDVRQVLAERLLTSKDGEAPKLADYSGRAPLVAWVRVAATRTALNLRRGKANQATDLESTLVEEIAAPGLDPEIDYFKLHYAVELKRALGEALAQLPAEQRLALRLVYLEGRSGHEIAAALGVDRSTIVRWLSRARADLFDATKKAMSGRLRISTEEFEGVARLVESRIEQSLARLLREA